MSHITKLMPTARQRCTVCKAWVTERTLPRDGYVRAACAAKGLCIPRRIKQLERDMAELRAGIARLEAQRGTPPTVGKPTPAKGTGVQGGQHE